MKVLTVDLADRSYAIYIGSGLLHRLQLFTDLLGTSQVLIVTNTTIAPLYLESFKMTLAAALGGMVVNAAVLPDGEQYKNWQTLGLIYDALLENRYERNTLLIALGGGVVGDMTGFVAATYQRGVNFIQVPTTLLSQVDSSVGGKTGINHPLGKNMIGAFYQPKAVIIDTDTLKTLPQREFSSGLAEVIKYGLICDAAFFSWLEQNIQLLMKGQEDALTEAIAKSCAIKASIVAADERESGKRALLNLGHTFGHAIEAQQGYGSWLHGEAVAAGILVAAQLSLFLGWLDEDQVQRIRYLLECAKLPTTIPSDMRVEDFFEKMSRDKKVQGGKIRYVLLKSIGEAVLTDEVNQDTVASAINRCRR
jgi:3-dehydroquinate synthase